MTCSTQMTIEGRDHDLFVRDPDHGQTNGHLVLLLRGKMTPMILFFLEVMNYWSRVKHPAQIL